MKTCCNFHVLFAIYFTCQSRARIIPSDDDLTVFPDTCKIAKDDAQEIHNCGIQRLDGLEKSWMLSTSDGIYKNVSVKTPGDILTDLQEAHFIGDPFYENNFLDQRHIWMGENREFSNGTSCYSSNGGSGGEYKIPNLERRTRTWIYETNFSLGDYDSDVATARRAQAADRKENKPQYSLVVEGIKMGASITMNGIHLGYATDQFLRYIFPIPAPILHSGLSSSNLLSVSFDPDIDTNGRFMACSGGWDWAPYSKAAENSCSSRRSLSFGIFKPIYIIETKNVAIVNVVPKIRYLGDATIKHLKDGHGFELVVDVHLKIDSVESITTGEILFRASFMPDVFLKAKNGHVNKSDVTSTYYVVSLKREISADSIDLWWPNSLGNQPLYTIRVAYRDTTQGFCTSWVKRRIGFRSIALITHNESDVIPREGTGLHGMYFRVNGVAVYARGANVVPMTQLEGRSTDEAHQILVESAIASNMNMLRVWGGGTVLPSSFYNSCDEKGILLYHDLMFVEEQYHGVKNTTEIGDEIRYIVRQLSSHPSIILWNGCNECDHKDGSGDLYERFAMTIVANEDWTRPVWGGSPSNGWSSGIFGRDGLPNGNNLILRTKFSRNIEKHGPYNHGSSEFFSSVNGVWSKESRNDTNTPVVLKVAKTGLFYTNQFISEFGASVSSSFESIHPTLSKENWALHGNPALFSNCSHIFENANECVGDNPMSQRNYPCDSLIFAHFGTNVNLDGIPGREMFQMQIFQCLISQMLWMKGQIEYIRSNNCFGTIIWQMNENWQTTGGWGLVEYGSQRNEFGQVIGGRWKPLMYLLRRFLFRDLFSTCGERDNGRKGICYIKNDGHRATTVKVTVESWDFQGEVKHIFSKQYKMNPHGATEYFEIDVNKDSLNSSVVVIHIFGDSNDRVVMGQNVVLWSLPKDLNGLEKDPKLKILTITPLPDGAIEIALKTEATVLYICLTSTIQGRFNDNLFSMPAGATKVVKFLPFDQFKTLDTAFLRGAFRIEHLGMALE